MIRLVLACHESGAASALRDALGRRSVAVAIADDEHDTIAQALSEPRADAIVIGSSMPGGGLLMCARIRANPEVTAIPIILVPRRLDETLERRAREAGWADAVMQAPLDADALLACVGTLTQTNTETSIVLDAADLVEIDSVRSMPASSVSGTMPRVQVAEQQQAAAGGGRSQAPRARSQRPPTLARVDDRSLAEALLSIRLSLVHMRGLPEPSRPLDATTLLETAGLQHWQADITAHLDGLRKDRENVNKRAAEYQTTIRKLEAQREESAAALAKSDRALRLANEAHERAITEEREQAARRLWDLQNEHEATVRALQQARSETERATLHAEVSERARAAAEQELERTEAARQQEIARAKEAHEEANAARAEAEKARASAAALADDVYGHRVRRLELEQELADTKARFDALTTALQAERTAREDAERRAESRQQPLTPEHDVEQRLAAQARQLADEYAEAKRDSDAKWMVELQGRVLAAIDLVEKDRAEALAAQSAAHETALARAEAAWKARRADLETEIRALALEVAKSSDALDEASERIASLEAALVEKTAAHDRVVLASKELSSTLAEQQQKLAEREADWQRTTRRFDETIERVQAALATWQRPDDG